MALTFSFNGVDSSTYGITASPTAPLLPLKRKNTVAIPGMDGIVDFGNNSYEPRNITFDCMIKAASRAARDAALASAALWLSGSGALILGRDATKRWPAAKLYNQIDINLMGSNNGMFQLVFECSPPWPEDVNATTGTIGTAQDYGSPMEFYPVITVTKSGTTATSLQIALASTGELMLVTDTIAAGDVLVFDMSAAKVTKNGVACMDHVSANPPFGVPPGTQTITVTTTSTYTASISYRKRYLYA
jgi:phage-related protein